MRCCLDTPESPTPCAAQSYVLLPNNFFFCLREENWGKDSLGSVPSKIEVMVEAGRGHGGDRGSESDRDGGVGAAMMVTVV